ncbi:MAG: hypothetical protein ACOVP7_11425 [Lacibacter sp.]
MKKLILLSLLMLGWQITFCQSTSTTSNESIIKMINDKNAAYHRQDWASMKIFIADSIKVYEFPNSLRDSTADGLIARYPKTFAKYPNNKITTIDITVIGNKAIIKDEVTGRGEPFYAVNIYEFDNDKIVKIWFISNSSTTQRPKD